MGASPCPGQLSRHQDGRSYPVVAQQWAPTPLARLLRNPVQVLLAHGGVKGALQGDALEASIHTRLAAPHAAQVVLPCRCGHRQPGAPGLNSVVTGRSRACEGAARMCFAARTAASGQLCGPAAFQATPSRLPSLSSCEIMLAVYWVQPTSDPSSTVSGLGPADQSASCRGTERFAASLWWFIAVAQAAAQQRASGGCGRQPQLAVAAHPFLCLPAWGAHPPGSETALC